MARIQRSTTHSPILAKLLCNIRMQQQNVLCSTTELPTPLQDPTSAARVDKSQPAMSNRLIPTILQVDWSWKREWDMACTTLPSHGHNPPTTLAATFFLSHLTCSLPSLFVCMESPGPVDVYGTTSTSGKALALLVAQWPEVLLQSM